MLPSCLVKEEIRLSLRTCQQAGSASKKTLFYWWTKAPHQPTTKLHGKPLDLVAKGRGKIWKGRGGKVKAAVLIIEAATEIAF